MDRRAGPDSCVAPDVLAVPQWLVQGIALLTTIALSVVMFTLAEPTSAVMSPVGVPGSMIVGLASVWPGRTIPRTAAFAASAAAHVLAVVGVGIALGRPVVAAAAGALGSLAYAVCVGRWFRQHSDSWIAATPRASLRGCAGAALLSPIMVVVWGAVDQNPGWTLTWVPVIVRSFVVMTVALCAVVPLFFASPRPARARGGVIWLVLAALALGAIAGCDLAPGLPLSWIVIVPVVLSAMLLGLRGVASLIFVVSLARLALPSPQPDPEGLDWVSHALLDDLLMAFQAQIAILVVTTREGLARLTRDLGVVTSEEQEKADFLSTIFQSMGDGLLLTDRAGRVTLSNVAAGELLGREVPDEFTPAWISAAQLQAGDARRIAALTDVIGATEGDGRPVDETDVVVPGGPLVSGGTAEGPAGHRRVSITHRPMRITDTDLTLHLLTDVTAERARQKELESFAGTVAHDLKGPLGALTSWLHAAEEDLAEDDVPSALTAMERAHSGATRMCALIDDYLALTVAREGTLTLRDIGLRELVDDVSALYEAGSGAGLTIEVDVPHVIHADAALTRQLFMNLIGNGIKYARPQEDAFIRVRSLDDEPGWTQVQIADRGVGLQPGDEELIFTAFTRSAKDAEAASGVGLGLSLCAAIVSRHGGWIRAENNEWGGATFRFTLPGAGTA